MNLTNAQEGIEYIIKDIFTDDDDLDAFLFYDADIPVGVFSGDYRTFGTAYINA